MWIKHCEGFALSSLVHTEQRLASTQTSYITAASIQINGFSSLSLSVREKHTHMLHTHFTVHILYGYFARLLCIRLDNVISFIFSLFENSPFLLAAHTRTTWTHMLSFNLSYWCLGNSLHFHLAKYTKTKTKVCWLCRYIIAIANATNDRLNEVKFKTV